MNKELYEIVISEIDVYFGDGDCIEPCDKKACAEMIVEVLKKAGYRKADDLVAEIAGLTGKLEALEQDNENLRRTIEEGAETIETPFERYLLDKLLRGGEDCCAYCAKAPENEACLSENEDDCRAGIRAFYEKFVEGK